MPDADISFLHSWVKTLLALQDSAANADLLNMLGLLNAAEKRQLWHWLGDCDQALKVELIEASQRTHPAAA